MALGKAEQVFRGTLALLLSGYELSQHMPEPPLNYWVIKYHFCTVWTFLRGCGWGKEFVAPPVSIMLTLSCPSYPSRPIGDATNVGAHLPVFLGRAELESSFTGSIIRDL